MMKRSRVEEVSLQCGFRPVVVEKVLRLCNILRRLDRHPTTAGKWLLKGGTALNILHLDVPRMSVDIDLNYVGSVDRAGMIAERPGFEAALVSICEREGCTVKRTPSEHAGGKFRLRYASVVGGSQNLEVDVSYVARVPLLGTERMQTRFPQDDPVEVTTLPLLELAAGKFTALMQRTVARDAFDAANLLQSIPDLLEDAEFRVAFVCSMAGGRHDPREMKLVDPAPSELDIRQQLLPVLQQSEDAPEVDPKELRTHLHRCLQGVATRLFDWSSAEREFLDRLHDKGEVDATILHSNPQVQQRIQTQPMLLWKAQNVRRHRKGTS